MDGSLNECCAQILKENEQQKQMKTYEIYV